MPLNLTLSQNHSEVEFLEYVQVPTRKPIPVSLKLNSDKCSELSLLLVTIDLIQILFYKVHPVVYLTDQIKSNLRLTANEAAHSKKATILIKRHFDPHEIAFLLQCTRYLISGGNFFPNGNRADLLQQKNSFLTSLYGNNRELIMSTLNVIHTKISNALSDNT
jgi:hypothetical protein